MFQDVSPKGRKVEDPGRWKEQIGQDVARHTLTCINARVPDKLNRKEILSFSTSPPALNRIIILTMNCKDGFTMLSTLKLAETLAYAGSNRWDESAWRFLTNKLLCPAPGLEAGPLCLSLPWSSGCVYTYSAAAVGREGVKEEAVGSMPEKPRLSKLRFSTM